MRFLVSIIILTKNGEKTIGECLAKVFSQNTNYKFEVIVIDSGSKDNTLQICEKYPVRLCQIQKKDFNHGLTRNQGVKMACGDFIVFLTQDAIPLNDHWLAPLIEDLEVDETVAGVYSRQIPRENADIFVEYNLSKSSLCSSKKMIKYVKDKGEYALLDPYEKFTLATYDNVSGVIRKSIWQKYPFSKTDFGEDLEWGKRVIEAGYKIVYESRSVVIHFHNRCLFYWFKRMYIHYSLCYRLFTLKFVSSLTDVRKSSRKRAKEYWKLIEKYNFGIYKTFCLKLYSSFLSLAQIGGEYMGYKSNLLLNKHKWYKKIDKFLKRGI